MFAETDVLGGRLSMLRSGLFEWRTAANLKFLALLVNHGIFLKKTCEMLVIAYAEKLLTDEEFLFLYKANKPVNLELPYYEYEEFNLEDNFGEA